MVTEDCVQFLIYMAPSQAAPILHVSKITSLPDVFNSHSVYVMRIHDIDGDGHRELVVSTHCGGTFWKRFGHILGLSLMMTCVSYVVYPRTTDHIEDRPFSRFYDIQLDPYTQYW